MRMLEFALVVIVFSLAAVAVADETPDPKRDILVTFDNDAAASVSAGVSAPYLYRKRYIISRQARRNAAAVAAEYSLKEIEHWPIRSLSIYCFVYRVSEGADRQSIIAKLNADERVESAQPLHSFETSTAQTGSYDDTYAGLQYGLDVLDIAGAHRATRGAGVRVALIDSGVDRKHEDLLGRIERIREFANRGQSADRNHGTAVASIIGARANNAVGIVGVAPEADLELYVSCWSTGSDERVICDTFSLSKALDAVLRDPPHVLNLSLTGPHDPLLERLIRKAYEAGVVIVAAGAAGANNQGGFPSSMQHVIGVDAASTEGTTQDEPESALFAPGHRILVALPNDRYEFRSGSSLAAAHVSGIIALMLAIAPNISQSTIDGILRQSQVSDTESVVSINACDALNLAGSLQHCGD